MQNQIKKQRNTIVLTVTVFLTMLPAFGQNPEFDTLSGEIHRISNYQKTKATKLLSTLYQMAHNSSDSSLLIAHCFYQEALLNLRQGTASPNLTQTIRQRLNKNSHSLYEQALLQSALGTSLMSEGKYSDAFPLQLQASEKYQQLNNSRYTALSLNALGNICQFINLLNLAEFYYAEALTHITPQFYEYYSIKFNWFTIQAYFNRNQSAGDSLVHLLSIVEKQRYEELLPMLYVNTGAYYLRQNMPDKALQCFTRMQSVDFDSPKMLAWLHANLGSYHAITGNLTLAMNSLKKALTIMEGNNDHINLSILYAEISNLFESRHQLDSALHYSKKNRQLTEQIHSNTIAIEMHQKYVTAYLETSKNELIMAEQKMVIKNRWLAIVIIISVASILLVLLFLLLVHQQKLRKAGENRELTARLEHEKKVQQYEKRQQKLIAEKQRELLDTKIREITTSSLLISSKNHILSQIMELNTQALNNTASAATLITKVNRIIRDNLNTDADWNSFKMHFEQVHPHFFEQLKLLCNDLTDENLKMCAYIKMRMTSKQIAQLLNIADRSVVIARHRIKKKLKLTDEQKLTDFICSLSQIG